MDYEIEGLQKHSFYSLTFKYSLTTELWHRGRSIIEHGCGTVGSVFQVRYLVGQVLDAVTPAIFICPFFCDTDDTNGHLGQTLSILQLLF